MTLYRYIPIWRRMPEGIALYRCFEILGVGFSVHSKDFFSADNIKERGGALEVQFLELLLEQAPESRFKPQLTIKAAIASFDAYFGE